MLYALRFFITLVRSRRGGGKKRKENLGDTLITLLILLKNVC